MDSAIDTHLQRITQLREQRTLLHHKLNDIEAEIWGLYHVVDTLRSSSAVAAPAPLPHKTPKPVFCIPETDWAEQVARSEARKGKPEFRFNK